MVEGFKSLSQKVIQGFQFALIVLIISQIFGCSTNRILESSSSTSPDWMFGVEKNYIITSGKGSTHEEAKLSAMNNLKEAIVNSVAVQVNSSTNYNTSESTEEIQEFMEVYENNLEVNSEYFEPLKGISVLKAEDFYWEKKRENGQSLVHYHIKYPFSDAQLNTLIRNFESLSSELESQIRAISIEAGTYKSVEELIENIRQLEYLKEVSPKSKKKAAANKIESLEGIFFDVNIRQLDQTRGSFTYGLFLYGDPINTNKLPEISSSCPIRIENVQSFQDKNVVEYKDEGCDTVDELKLKVLYRYSDYKLQRSFYLPTN